MLPGPMSGRSMLPPWLSGRERVDRVDLRRAAQRADVRPVGQRDPVAPVAPSSRRQSILRTISGSGWLSVAVSRCRSARRTRESWRRCRAGCSPRGTIDSMCTASASPFSAPSIMIGPFCGFSERHAQLLARQVGLGLDARRSKASRVSTTTRSPGCDAQHRLRVGPDREMELGLPLLGERVRLARLADGAAAPVHDRLRDPVVVAHGAVS